jgi:tetratricopeptide (TPR) repeat protein
MQERALAASVRDPLDEARALLAAGELDKAEEKVTRILSAAPGRGAAHLVLGLIHYRAGRYHEALAEFTKARDCVVPALPGPIAFNEGAVWFALDQYDKARASFLEAARIAPDLAFLATINAAEAALAAGDVAVARDDVAKATHGATTPERQRVVDELRQRLENETQDARVRLRKTLRERARAALADDEPAKAEALYRQLLADTGEPALSVAESNLFEHGLGLSLLRQKRFEDAVRHFANAAALDEHDGDSVYMEGLASYRMGELGKARALFRAALQRDCDAETAASIRGFLDRLSFGGRRGGGGLSTGLAAGAGYDSNVIQGMDARPETITADRVGSPGAFLMTASVTASYQWLLRSNGFLAVDYGASELAYPDEDHADSSFQTHTLRLRAEWTALPDLRLGLVVSDDLQFSGLGGFHPFQNVVGAEPFVAFDESPATSTAVGVGVQGKKALDPDFDYFSGSRFDVLVRQRLRWPSLHAELAYRYRRERIGVRSAELVLSGVETRLTRRSRPVETVTQTTYLYVAPYSYDSHALIASGEASVGVWRLGIDASVENLGFRGDSLVYEIMPLTGSDRLTERRHRSDLRLGGAASLTASLSRAIDCTLRYDLIDNRSTLVLAVDDRNYIKHLVSLTLEAEW